ncbi:RNA polymerase sigma factor [Niabella sp. CJ426]|uniref:RNA polymerase sigma factor n=1 Tax=Niabella sp. CJ426 TaxID=3393740 RepID=UPI003D0799C5
MSAYATYTDEELIILIKQDNKAAFDEIYKRYWDKLFVTATNRLGNSLYAEDIVQDVLVKLWVSRFSLQIKNTLRTYLSAAIKYEVINKICSLKHQKKYIDSFDESAVSNITERQVDFSVLENRLSRLVKDLPEKCRMTFILSREYGFSQKEIAGYMNVSENTVESHMKKALKTLRIGLNRFIFTLFW